jgi:hypothetical protein
MVMSAPKQLAKRRKLEKKRLRKRETRLRRQKQRGTDWFGPDPLDSTSLICGPVGGVKMSTVLEDFMAPLIECANGWAEYERLFRLGQLAWNVALAPQAAHEGMIDEAVREAMPDASFWAQQECRELLNWLVARKLKSFARYERPILGFQLDELEDGGFYLSVMSGLVM